MLFDLFYVSNLRISSGFVQRIGVVMLSLSPDLIAFILKLTFQGGRYVRIRARSQVFAKLREKKRSARSARDKSRRGRVVSGEHLSPRHGPIVLVTCFRAFFGFFSFAV